MSTLLHGDLKLTIIEARALGELSKVNSVLGLVNLRATKHWRVTVSVAKTTVARTRSIAATDNPRWNQQFDIPLAHTGVHLEFKIKVGKGIKIKVGKGIKGTAKISAVIINTGDPINGWFPLTDDNGDPCENSALNIEMKFTPCGQNSLYSQGIASDPGQAGVRNTYFPLRKGNALKLYQDAHVPEGMLPEIELEHGRVFEHHKCWEDICHAISEARHMIYIVGWSLRYDIKLIREPSRSLPPGVDLTLGELLESKRAEGVEVGLWIWEDKTSFNKMGIKMGGLMKTYCKETRKSFEDSYITCCLVGRQASKSFTRVERFLTGTIFSNHQKFVLVDTQAAGSRRRITAFLGGLDLCHGRYDTPEHRLFCNLDTIFENDFHNPTFPSKTKAPREPWHDLHCWIDGQAAYDVFLHFKQYCRQAARKEKYLDALEKLESISRNLSPYPTESADGATVVPEDDSTLRVSDEDGSEKWHVQILRSIDSGAVEGFPKDPGRAYAQNLVCSKGLVIDESIQRAYIQSIRSAQHFIYIENQYFIGSSYAWPSDEKAGADNLIPMELALKITSKIRAGQRFAVYVVIPMWPEGNPNSERQVQEILCWQSQTMKMMYGIIAKELQERGHGGAHPRDYLNFYCLGKREPIPGENPASNVDEISKSQEFQRFMIYVHAKGMVVDDEYVILGSANINQRSMDGSRDTEIAMGAYQPHCTWDREHPRGEVFGYRKSLWAEHLGTVDGIFDDPASLECVTEVNKIAEKNWVKYTAAEFTVLQGYLLKYPIEVDQNGEVRPLHGYETFPDVGGQVFGRDSLRIPDIVTT
ncbi:hypothetical protein SLA2020_092620 [Shorea laevis]